MAKKNNRKIKTPKFAKGHSISPRCDDGSTPFSSNSNHPAFCFRYVDSDYSIKKCDPKLQAACAQRLQYLGQMSWAEIQKADRHGAGHEKISQQSIKQPLPKKTPGDRQFLAFRLGHAKNSVIVGYRKEKVFYIVWVDPHGKIYEHG